jgi:hypothetical protein
VSKGQKPVTSTQTEAAWLSSFKKATSTLGNFTLSIINLPTTIGNVDLNKSLSSPAIQEMTNQFSENLKTATEVAFASRKTFCR